jgi:hypothetical protein
VASYPDSGLLKPSGTVVDIKKVRNITVHRHREEQPQMNQPTQDTVPGAGSGDQ